VEDEVVILDGEAGQVVLAGSEAAILRATFDAAMVSACPSCRSGILALLAFSEALDDAPPIETMGELRVLVEDAPTLHLYVVDESSSCEHPVWRDPGYEEWADIMDELEE